MPIIGYLSNKADPRWLLTFGFFTFGLTTLYFGNVTLDLSPTTLLVPILITGFGLSFVFVPITTAAYGTLRNDQIGNASGLFNLMRNIGGSIGISVAQTLLTRRTDVHQNEIINSVPHHRPAVPELHRSNPTSSHRPLLRPQQHPRPRPGHPLPATQAARPPTGPSSTSSAGSLSSASSASIIVWFFKKVKPGKPPAGAH